MAPAPAPLKAEHLGSPAPGSGVPTIPDKPAPTILARPAPNPAPSPPSSARPLSARPPNSPARWSAPAPQPKAAFPPSEPSTPAQPPRSAASAQGSKPDPHWASLARGSKPDPPQGPAPRPGFANPLALGPSNRAPAPSTPRAPEASGRRTPEASGPRAPEASGSTTPCQRSANGCSARASTSALRKDDRPLAPKGRAQDRAGRPCNATYPWGYRRRNGHRRSRFLAPSLGCWLAESKPLPTPSQARQRRFLPQEHRTVSRPEPASG